MSDLFYEIARKNETAIRCALKLTRQVAVAEAIGVSEATLSRFKEPGGQLEQYAQLLAAVGLKVVPLSHEVYDVEEMQALLVLAKRGLAAAKSVRDMAAFMKRFAQSGWN